MESFMAKKKTAKKVKPIATSKDVAAKKVVKKKAADGVQGTKSTCRASRISDTAIARVRETGATHLRTVWDGWNDGGSFVHKLYFSRKGVPEDCNDDELDKEIERLLLRNGLADEYDGTACGTVGILALNLRTGAAV